MLYFRQKCDSSGTPGDFKATQSMGKVYYSWIDNSLCEKVFSLTRDGESFIGDVEHNAQKQCRTKIASEITFDDLRFGGLKNGQRNPLTKHKYCVLAAATIGAGAKPYSSETTCIEATVVFEVRLPPHSLLKRPIC